jgi:hypothetical protein
MFKAAETTNQLLHHAAITSSALKVTVIDGVVENFVDKAFIDFFEFLLALRAAVIGTERINDV